MASVVNFAHLLGTKRPEPDLVRRNQNPNHKFVFECNFTKGSEKVNSEGGTLTVARNLTGTQIELHREEDRLSHGRDATRKIHLLSSTQVEKEVSEATETHSCVS